ncbi:MAG: hypothetical protein FWG02_11310 [Holophagaceae bacterium]|nr:hypothetical protein [Holophagaceae bacterium]
MNLVQLLNHATDKTRFEGINDYFDFCREYLRFAHKGLQAVIVSRNETHYQFLQYKQDGNFNITRPLNSNIMIHSDDFDKMLKSFRYILARLTAIPCAFAPKGK